MTGTKPKKPHGVLTWIMRVVLAVTAVLLLTIGILALLSPIDVSALLPRIETALTQAVGRPVSVLEPIEASVGFAPEVSVGGLRLESLETGQEDISVTALDAKLDLVPLFMGRIRGEMVAGQLALTAGGESDPTLALEDLRVEADGDETTIRTSGSVLGHHSEFELRGGQVEALIRPEAPWPVEGHAAWGNLKAEIAGDLRLPVGGTDLNLNTEFSLIAENGTQLGLPEKLAARADAPAVSLRGRFDFDGQIARAELSESHIGHSGLEGAATIQPDGAQTRIEGHLDIDRVDLADWAAPIPDTADPEPKPEPGDSGEPVALDPDALFGKLVGRLDLAVGELAGSPVSISGITVPLTLEAERIGIDGASAEIAGGRTEYMASITRADNGLELNGRVDLKNAHLDATTISLEEIDGGIDAISGSLSASGLTLETLLQSVNLDLTVSGLAVTYEDTGTGANPIPIRVPESTLNVEPASIRWRATGELLAEAVTTQLELTRPENWRSPDAEWGFELDLESRGARFYLDGTAARGRVDAGFDFKVPDPPALAAWLGEVVHSAPAMAAGGRLSWQPQRLALEDLALTVADQHATGQLAISGAPPNRRLDGTLDVDRLSLDALREFLQSTAAQSDPSAADVGISLDVPILPTRLNLPDAALSVTAADVKFPKFPLRDFRFQLVLNDGAIEPSEFGARVFGTTVTGSLQLDGRSGSPVAEVSMSARKVDLAKVGAALAIRDLPPIDIDRLDLRVSGEGVTLADLMTSGQTQLKLAGIRLPRQNIRITEALSTAGGGRIELKGTGEVGPLPASFKLALPGIAKLLGEDSQLPVTVGIDLADASLGLDGTFTRPVDSGNVDFALELRGESLAAFSPLAESELPPIGPYELSAQVALEGQRLELNEVVVKVGNSDLSGRVLLDRSSPRTQAELTLNSERFQIDDFVWDTGEAPPDPDADAPASDDPLGAQIFGERWGQLQFLDRADVRLEVTAQSVRSGEDVLGGGGLSLSGNNRRVDLERLHLDLPGGEAELSASLSKAANGLQGAFKIDVEDFDFGVLARRVDPETSVSGLIGIHADLETSGPDLRRILSGANGKLDLGVWPINMSANVFDLWAVSLMNAVMPQLDPDAGGSVFNCAVVTMQAQDGVMRDETLLIDSTRITAGGDLEIDFKDEYLTLRLASRPKTPTLFSAQTPIEVKGSFEDFRVGLVAGAGVETFLRMVSSPITFPFELVFRKRLPADGAEACRQAFQRSD